MEKTITDIKRYEYQLSDGITRPMAYIEYDEADVVDAPLWYHKQKLMQTATGYGRKLNTGRKIRFNGKLYRVYAICYSNASSSYIIVKKEMVFLR